jgi:hypothetical protein
MAIILSAKHGISPDSQISADFILVWSATSRDFTPVGSRQFSRICAGMGHSCREVCGENCATFECFLSIPSGTDNCYPCLSDHLLVSALYSHILLDIFNLTCNGNCVSRRRNQWDEEMSVVQAPDSEDQCLQLHDVSKIRR